MKVLAIGAHFDDVELGCGGSIAKHVDNGDQVYVYVVTQSGFSNQNNHKIRANNLAYKEAQDAQKILGIKELICGKFKTLEVEFEDLLNIEILKIIQKHNIDLVYTHWIGDIHHDHQSVSRASLHSCRHVKKMLMYRSNWYHSTVDFRGNFYIDITNYWHKKEKSILAYKTENKRTGGAWINFFKNEAENAGQRIGVPLAEVFEVVKYLA